MKKKKKDKADLIIKKTKRLPWSYITQIFFIFYWFIIDLSTSFNTFDLLIDILIHMKGSETKWQIILIMTTDFAFEYLNINMS